MMLEQHSDHVPGLDAPQIANTRPVKHVRHRQFALKPDDAHGIAVAVTAEMQQWGGFDDAWRDMLPEGRDEFTAALAAIIRRRVNRMSRGVK